MEEVACNEDEVNTFTDGIGDDGGEGSKEVFVALLLAGRGAVGFAEMNISSMVKFANDVHSLCFPSLVDVNF